MIELFANSRHNKNDKLNQVVIDSLYNPKGHYEESKSLKKQLFIGFIKRYVEKNMEL